MAEFTPPCLQGPEYCAWAADKRADWSERCVEMIAKIKAAGGAGALEASLGCPQQAARTLMHAAVDGEPVSTAIELNLGFDAQPFTDAFRRRGDI